MKTSKNKFAITLWAFAAVFLVTKLVGFAFAFEAIGKGMANMTGWSAFSLGVAHSFWDVQTAVATLGNLALILFFPAVLTALGVIINLINKSQAHN